jgi:hypothetical protein
LASSQSPRSRSSGGATPATFHVPANTLRHISISFISIRHFFSLSSSAQCKFCNTHEPVLDRVALVQRVLPPYVGELGDEPPPPVQQLSWPENLNQR